jgi:CRISPR-associated protein Csd2
MNVITRDQVSPETDKSAGPLTDLWHIVVLVEAAMVNPNGDPDTGNLPRQDAVTSHGIISNVSTKRKIRDYLAEVHGVELYHANGVVLREQRAEALRKNGIEPSKEAEAPEAPQEVDTNGKRNGRKQPNKRENVSVDDLRRNQRVICGEYYDARAFGAVMDTGAARAANGRGPVVVSQALSVDPVRIIEQAITRQSVEKPEEKEKERTMGSQAMVRYGLYRYDVTVHPFHAARTGFTAQDLALLREALVSMYELDQSSNRQLTLRGIYAFRHASQDGAPCLGHARRASLLERVVVSKRDGVEEPLHFADYEIRVDEDGLPEGVTLERWD